MLLCASLLLAGGCLEATDSDLDEGVDAAADDADLPESELEGDAGADADVPAEAEAEAGADADADVAEDDGAVGPTPLSTEEIDLILSGGADTPMDIVTNETPEGDAFLHEVSVDVDPTDPTVQQLIARMRRTLAASAGGVGLAAPQVGIHRRIFLAQRTDQAGMPVQAFLNPLIVEVSPETRAAAEGCLSVPGANPSVTRSLWITIDYDGEDAVPVIGETIGSITAALAAYAARIVQHEYDHLEGVLIIDPAP
jgi:peptide deformylase